MPKTTTLTVADARRRLRLFNEKADALGRSGFRAKVSIEDHGFTMNLGPDAGTIEKRGADEESTNALALNLRFFVQERDGISFKQISELYRLLPVPDEDRQAVRAAIDRVEDYMDELVPIVYQGEKLTNRRFFKIFMYGGLAHVNQDERDDFEHLVNTPFRPMMETFFEEIVAHLLNVIFSFHQTNERAIQALDALHDDSRLLAHGL